MRTLWRTVTLLGTLVLISACGAHLYDEQSHIAAKDAKAAIDKADYTAVIATERRNLDSLLTAELQLSDQSVDTLKRLNLAQLLTSGDGVATPAQFREKLGKAIDARFVELGVTSAMTPEELAGLATLDLRLEDYEFQLNDTAETFFESLGFHLPRCTTALETLSLDSYRSSLDAGKRARLDQMLEPAGDIFAQYKEDCAQFLKGDQDIIEKLPGGLIFQSAADLREAKLARAELALAARDALERFHAAEKDLKDALATDPAPSELLKPKIETLREALTGVQEGAGFIGTSVASNEMLAEVDAVLAAIAQDPENDGASDPSASPSVAMLAALPSFADKADNIADLLTAPPVSALIIEKQRLKVLKLQAQREADRMDQRIALLQGRLVILVSEARSLLKARNALGLGGERNLLLAIGHYLSTFNLHRTAQEQIDYQIINLDHQIAVDYSEDSLALWYALIQQPADQLIAYFDSGVRREEILQFLQALGIVAGGVGLNR